MPESFCFCFFTMKANGLQEQKNVRSRLLWRVWGEAKFWITHEHWLSFIKTIRISTPLIVSTKQFYWKLTIQICSRENKKMFSIWILLKNWLKQKKLVVVVVFYCLCCLFFLCLKCMAARPATNIYFYIMHRFYIVLIYSWSSSKVL